MRASESQASERSEQSKPKRFSKQRCSNAEQKANAKQSKHERSECERQQSRTRAEATKPAQTISGDYSLRDPPVPIPNTEVKPQHADGTWLETARESRSSPDSNET